MIGGKKRFIVDYAEEKLPKRRVHARLLVKRVCI